MHIFTTVRLPNLLIRRTKSYDGLHNHYLGGTIQNELINWLENTI